MNWKKFKECEFVQVILRIFGKKPRLTADQCWNLSRFGKNVKNMGSLVEDVVDDLEELITYKLSCRHEDTIIVKSVPEYQSDLYRMVAEHFKKQGFTVIITNFSEIDEDTEFIIISWKNGSLKNKNTEDVPDFRF